jgi:uncharacterized protein (DUF3084 family)
MRKKVLQTNRSAARPAAMRVRATPVEIAPDRCTMRYARSAEDPAKFLSNRVTTVRYTVEIVSENNLVSASKGPPFKGRPFFCVAREKQFDSRLHPW